MATVILEPKHIDAILEFERNFLSGQSADPMEADFAEWHASWRKESLEHYLPQGWSFGIFEDERLQGYFIAQPQLYTRGMAQTLWVERVQALDAKVAGELIDIAYRISREKHLQKVVFNATQMPESSGTVLQLARADEQIVEIKTTKF